jgi:hypothetical protein
MLVYILLISILLTLFLLLVWVVTLRDRPYSLGHTQLDDDIRWARSTLLWISGSGIVFGVAFIMYIVITMPVGAIL